MRPIRPDYLDRDTINDDAFQDTLLQGVSRTFALTIPRLPPILARPVSNAYLLCRIVDTIEDEATLEPETKKTFCDRFVKVVQGTENADILSNDLGPLLSDKTLPAEQLLIRVMPRVIAITHSFYPGQQEALIRCVRIMSRGMAEFQSRDLRIGLASLEEMDHYCYYVAGVVGEMLTCLFCHYSDAIAVHSKEMMRLSVSFGQGLQMTNILKDIWEDYKRNVCWLPREVFLASGLDLQELQSSHNDPRFHAGLKKLIGITHGHLKNALDYTLRIPVHETGIREFCLWALGMALCTLRKIHAHINFSTSSQVKISRRTVRTVILVSRILRSSNMGLSAAFSTAGAGLPYTTIPFQSPVLPTDTH